MRGRENTCPVARAAGGAAALRTLPPNYCTWLLNAAAANRALSLTLQRAGCAARGTACKLGKLRRSLVHPAPGAPGITHPAPVSASFPVVGTVGLRAEHLWNPRAAAQSAPVRPLCTLLPCGPPISDLRQP